MPTVKIQRPRYRMSATDAGFLYLERPHAPLHIGSVAIVDGALTAAEVARRIERRLARVWRYAQRPLSVPLSLAHPIWEDAPDFDVLDHVHGWGLPSPGGEFELLDTIARLLSQPLDRSRPLWEIHVLEGLAGGRTVVFQKVHHCMIDGVSGARLLEELLDPSPDSDCPPCTLPFRRPGPGCGALVFHALGHRLRRHARANYAIAHFLRHGLSEESARSLVRAVHSGLHLATDQIPELPWNAPLGRRRRLSFTRLPMADVKQIRTCRGGTINDIVLCVLSGGLHRYLQGIGRGPGSLEVTALVPVSLRGPDEAKTLGNRLSAMVVPLPVDLSEETSRLSATRAVTQQLKAGGVWTAIGALLELIDALPPALVARVGHSVRIPRLANVLATNVPGPRERRYLCGRRVDAIYPIVPIVDHMGLGLAVFSYNSWLHIGLNADADLVPDLEKLRLGIEESFASLLASSQTPLDRPHSPDRGNRVDRRR
jgi:WS/DGAT/MGAT family acyltransferase